MIAAYCVHMAYEGMRGRRCIPAWRALHPRERLIFFGSVGGRSTTWN